MRTSPSTRPRTTTAAPDPETAHRSPAGLVLATALPAMVLIGLDGSAVNVALPAIGADLGGSTAALQWIVDAYVLMFAALLLSAGAISDRIGAKRVFIAGLAVFTAASAVCGVTPGLGALVVGRLAQGAAAAMMLPSSLALVRQAYPEARARARAISLWAVGGSVSIAAGPIVGGLLTGAASWRGVFFLNVPVGIAALVLLTRAARSPRRIARLDPAGQLTAVLALAALTFGVIEGGSRGFTNPVVLASLAVAVLAGAAFAVVERRAADPMIPFALFRSRTVSATVLVGFSVNVAFYGTVFVLGLYFQQVLRASPVLAGLLFLPMTGLISASNVLSGRVAARFGPRRPILAGQLVAAAAPFALLVVDEQTSPLLVAVLLVPLGAGLGFAIPALIAAMVDGLPADRAGLAGGVLNASRQTGGALAVAVFGVLVGGNRAGFVPGLHASLLISGVALLATAAIALLLPKQR